MQLDLDSHLGGLRIDAYGVGWARIGARRFEGSLALSRERVIDEWTAPSLAELTADHFRRLAELNPELVLLGTGANLTFPATELTVPLIERGIGLEVMDTAAAIRTYNLLAGDGRAVVAALILG
ncbi:Mth938-like domain-containing protein [Endothiovibrio diazotrophicus]